MNKIIIFLLFIWNKPNKNRCKNEFILPKQKCPSRPKEWHKNKRPINSLMERHIPLPSKYELPSGIRHLTKPKLWKFQFNNAAVCLNIRNVSLQLHSSLESRDCVKVSADAHVDRREAQWRGQGKVYPSSGSCWARPRGPLRRQPLWPHGRRIKSHERLRNASQTAATVTNSIFITAPPDLW